MLTFRRDCRRWANLEWTRNGPPHLRTALRVEKISQRPQSKAQPLTHQWESCVSRESPGPLVSSSVRERDHHQHQPCSLTLTVSISLPCFISFNPPSTCEVRTIIPPSYAGGNWGTGESNPFQPQHPQLWESQNHSAFPDSRFLDPRDHGIIVNIWKFPCKEL